MISLQSQARCQVKLPFWSHLYSSIKLAYQDGEKQLYNRVSKFASKFSFGKPFFEDLYMLEKFLLVFTQSVTA